MNKVVTLDGLNIYQKNFQQILIRGDGRENFNKIIKENLSVSPPSKNLEVTNTDKYLFAKSSFDQWNLLYLEKQEYNNILINISKLNKVDEILATDYSYGQVYFEVIGKNKDQFLNKLTQFDLRPKKFPFNSMAQTLIARIECSIFNLKDKYIITCNRSFESYFIERLKDIASL